MGFDGHSSEASIYPVVIIEVVSQNTEDYEECLVALRRLRDKNDKVVTERELAELIRNPSGS